MAIKSKNGSTPKAKRKESAAYHAAAFNAIGYRLNESVERGYVTLEDEHRLSKRPLVIDIMIIKKRCGAELEPSWAKIFRGHNVLEYKSPVDGPLTLSVFDKAVHGYAGIYASQNEVKLTDMSVTMACFKKPVELFGVLKSEFGYRVLRKGSGVYYIIQKGMPPEKALAVQVVAYSELEDCDLVLRDLRPGIDVGTAGKVVELLDGDPKAAELLVYWSAVMWLLNEETLKKEKKDMRDLNEMVRSWAENGDLAEFQQETEQKARLEGRLEGMARLYEYLKSGHSLEEAEKMFALQ